MDLRLRVTSVAFASCWCLFTACSSETTKNDNFAGSTTANETTGAGTTGTAGRSGSSGSAGGGEIAGHAGSNGLVGAAPGKGFVKLTLKAK